MLSDLTRQWADVVSRLALLIIDHSQSAELLWTAANGTGRKTKKNHKKKQVNLIRECKAVIGSSEPSASCCHGTRPKTKQNTKKTK